jgi:DNA repair protein RecO (recombination protein O)
VVQLGGVVCDDCAPSGAPRVGRVVIDLLAALVKGDWAAAETTDQGTRAKASGIVSAYTQWHLERGLRSLPYVSRAAGEPA